MKCSILATASSILLLSWNAAAQSSTAANLKPIQTLDCYQNVDPLVKLDDYTFATDGWCQEKCGDLNKPVMALTAGSTCYCGDTIPALDKAVAESNCDSPCNGFGTKNCGGIGYWQVYLTGLTTEVQYAPNNTDSSSSSSSSASGSATTPAVVTKAGETVVVTASNASPSPQAASAGPNKVGIAAGVVVGVVGVSGLIGTLIYFLKQRKKRAIEEEHRRLEAVAAAEKSEASSIRTDQRLDPSNIFSHRRESIGSIADEMDFSRRILQVRNPDRFSTNSGAA